MRSNIRSARRTPSASRTGVGRNVQVPNPLIRDVLEDVGQRRSATAAHAAGRPRLGFKGHQRAVFLSANLDIAVVGRTRAGHHQLFISVQHQLDRVSGDLGELGASHAPSVDVELQLMVNMM